MGGDNKTYYRAVIDPLMYAGAVFRMQLEANGIAVGGAVVKGSAPSGAHELIVFEGFPISEIVQRFVKYSNNSMAETLVKVLGARQNSAMNRDAQSVSFIRPIRRSKNR